jgi:hypothetical protein
MPVVALQAGYRAYLRHRVYLGVKYVAKYTR